MYYHIRRRSPLRKEAMKLIRKLQTIPKSVLKNILSIALSLSLLCYSVIASSITIPVSTSEKRLTPIYRVSRNDNLVGLSFDAAWGADKTEKILDVLKENNVKATFFLVSFWAEKYPDLVKRIASEGHEIGTHSATHPHFNKLSNEKKSEELQKSVETIERISGTKVTLFRPPFGEYDNALILISKELNLTPIQWDVDSLDWKGISSDEIYRRVTTKTKSGSIILCHNNADNIVEGIKKFIPALKEKGFEITAIGNVILKGEYTIDSSGEQNPA